jgi:hypothetical protein
VREDLILILRMVVFSNITGDQNNLRGLLIWIEITLLRGLNLSIPQARHYGFFFHCDMAPWTEFGRGWYPVLAKQRSSTTFELCKTAARRKPSWVEATTDVRRVEIKIVRRGG